MARKTKTTDPKSDALRAQGSLNTRPEDVTTALFQSSDFFDPRDLVQVKYEMLRRVRVDARPITETAAAFGFSRPSFYQAQSAFELAGLGGLLPKKPGPQRAHKLSGEVMDFLEQLLRVDPSLRPADLVERAPSGSTSSRARGARAACACSPWSPSRRVSPATYALSESPQTQRRAPRLARRSAGDEAAA